MSRRIPIGILRQTVTGLFGGKSNRQIADQIHQDVSHCTVGKIRTKVKKSTYDETSLKQMSDLELSEFVYGKAPSKSYIPSEARDLIVSQVDYFKEELKGTGVTRLLLWQEFLKQYPEIKGEDSCSYQTFCRILSDHMEPREVTFVNRKPSSEFVVMIDFAGDKLYYTDRATNQKIACTVLVAVMEHSLYSFVEVLPDARTPNLLRALSNCISYFGGVPDRLLTDNMRQLVKKADKYEPTFTDAAIQWANHYGIFLSATRSRCPRDKHQIERLVNIVYTRIYAALRKKVFYNLNDLKEAVKQRLGAHNDMLLTGKDYSRREKFFKDEQPHLNPLPDQCFELQKVTRSKVSKESHVLLGEDQCNYSVPYKYIGKSLDILYTAEQVEIYYLLTWVASHPRSPNKKQYITDEAHLPPNLKAQLKVNSWTKEDYLKQATMFGPHTTQFVESMFNSKAHASHAYRPCQGLLTLGLKRKFGSARLEQACELAKILHKDSYKDVEKILKTEGDIYFKSLGQLKKNNPTDKNQSKDEQTNN